MKEKEKEKEKPTEKHSDQHDINNMTIYQEE